MRWIVLAVTALLLSVAACGVSPPGNGQEATPTPELLSEAEEILAQARAAMAELSSYQYDLVIANEQYPHSLFPPPERTGAWAAPDRWLLTYDGVDVTRMIGDQMWSRRIPDGLDAPWYAAPSALAPPIQAPDRPFLYMTAPVLLAEETLDGEPVYRLGGLFPPDAGSEMEMAPAREVDPLHVELFVRQSDHLPVRLVILDAYRGVSASPPGVPPEPLPTQPEEITSGGSTHGLDNPRGEAKGFRLPDPHGTFSLAAASGLATRH